MFGNAACIWKSLVIWLQIRNICPCMKRLHGDKVAVRQDVYVCQSVIFVCWILYRGDRLQR